MKRHHTYSTLALLSSVRLVWDSAVVMEEGVGSDGWYYILTTSLLLPPLSWERHCLAICMSPFDPELVLLAISTCIRLKRLPHQPQESHYVTASELHGSQGWELIGHFMAVSLLSHSLHKRLVPSSRCHYSEKIDQSSRVGCKNELLDTFKIQTALL